jgi:mono/diheme cytochrome c family protein
VKPESNTMSAFSRAARAAVVASLPFSFSACTWFTDFKNQPRLEPWESFAVSVNDTMAPPRYQPQMSVPVQGTLVAGVAISYTPSPVTVDSMSSLPNPTPATEASLDNGRMFYSINCAMCHGALGDGNGSMKQLNPAYGYSPSLLTESARGRTDGYMWGMLRNGRGIMPNYARIEEADRWDVVNYVRALQAGTAIIGPHGMPGQNGTTVPRASATAPALPAPFTAPEVTRTPGSSGKNAATTGRDKMSFPSGSGTAHDAGHDADHDEAASAQEMCE